MGLANYILEAVVREHCHRAITGAVVQIGRQTFELTVPAMIELFGRYGLSTDVAERAVEIDHQTTQVRQTGKPFVSDRAFFGALGITEVHAVDHSDFEGADIIHDMNRPIGRSLEGIADLILDGSTLDNVHDPAIALMNYNRMLRPGGRVVSINAAKPDIMGAYTGMAAEWFLDYYAINDYADCRIYVQLNLPDGPVALAAMDYKWVVEHGHAPTVDHDGWVFAIVVAEKGKASNWDRIPARANLRTDIEQAHWLASIKRFSASDRSCHFESGHPEIALPAGFLTARFSPIMRPSTCVESASDSRG
jgi:SAM-dependent methyltransferase